MKITPEQYKAALKIIKDYRDQLKAELASVEKEVRAAELKKHPHKNLTIYELMSKGQCSVRLHNVIYSNWDVLSIKRRQGKGIRIIDLEGASIQKLLSCRNAGEGTVKEFQELCNSCGVKYAP